MSVNLRQADVIWEPDRPVRRAEERDRGLPKEKQTHGVTPQFRRRRKTFARNIIDNRALMVTDWEVAKRVRRGKGFENPPREADFERNTGGVGVSAAH